MKRLLLIPALALPVLLFSCHSKAPVNPTPTEVIQQGHEDIKTPAIKPEAAKVSPRHHVAHVKHKRPKRKPVAQMPLEDPRCPIRELPCPWSAR